MRCWAKKVGTKVKDPESYQAKILAVQPTLQADFSNAAGQFSCARAANKPRFIDNPNNWGPRPKHGRPMLKHELDQADRRAVKNEPAEQLDITKCPESYKADKPELKQDQPNEQKASMEQAEEPAAKKVKHCDCST